MHAKFSRTFCLLRRGAMHEESLDSRRASDDTAGGGGVKLPVIDRIAEESPHKIDEMPFIMRADMSISSGHHIRAVSGAGTTL